MERTTDNGESATAAALSYEPTFMDTVNLLWTPNEANLLVSILKGGGPVGTGGLKVS